MINGLVLVFQWPAIGFLFLGILIGMWLGAVPGLGGIIGLVLLLPFTFDMDPVPAFALLLGMYAVTSTSDTISSVMLGIPGTAASQATVLDGYPMAKMGQAARAFGAAFTVSAFGGVVGALIMAVSLPILLPVILAFGVPEFLMLAILGLTMVGALAGGSIYKGLAVAAFGLWLTTIGYAESTGIPRYVFDTEYLLERLPIIPVVLGLFAIPELLEMAVRNTSISRVPQSQTGAGGLVKGMRDVLIHWWLTVRCALLGTYVGMLPGLGPSIVDWIAYGHAVQTAKDKSRFGRGDIRGVIAPEAANNASKPGALIPTIAFGIPGSLGTAILLGALIIKGLRPGPEMLVDHLDLTFSMVWDIVLANIIATGLLLIWSKQVAKVAFLPGHLLVPGVAIFVLMGAWIASADLGDWISCIGFGFLGYWMKQGGWPRPPLILALVLGKLIEDNLDLSLQVFPNYTWLYQRPIVLVIVAMIVLTLVLSATGTIKAKPRSAQDAQEGQSEQLVAGEGSGRNPIFSLPLALCLTALFIWAPLEAMKWELRAAQFPFYICMVGLALLIVILVRDARDLIYYVKESRNFAIALGTSAASADLLPALAFAGYLVAIIPVSMAIGQQLALPLFILIYLLRWGRYGWIVSLIYSAVAGVFIHVFYDSIMHLHFIKSWLFG